jgi:hypothetical protein
MARCTVRLRSFSSTLGSILSACREKSTTAGNEGFSFGEVNGPRDGGAYVSENVGGLYSVVQIVSTGDGERFDRSLASTTVAAHTG